MDTRKQQICSFSSYIERKGAKAGARERTAERAAFTTAAAYKKPPKKRRSALSEAALFAFLMLCTLGFSLLFALKLASPAEAVPTFKGMLYSPDGGSDEQTDEQLGRLRFVQFPGLLSVFAPSAAPIMPLKSEAGLVDESQTARLFALPGTEVVSVLDGTVRSVDEYGRSDAFYKGGSVTVAHADGVEITYYGLAPISVERGQSVLQRSPLGLTAGDTLFIRVTKNGRPVDPMEFLGTGARLG